MYVKICKKLNGKIKHKNEKIKESTDEKNKKIWMVKNKSAVNLINEKKDVNLQRRK